VEDLHKNLTRLDEVRREGVNAMQICATRQEGGRDTEGFLKNNLMLRYAGSYLHVAMLKS
jgi:hypothetical protein